MGTYKIPEQVFTTLGFKKDSKSDMDFLNAKYKEKSNKKILSLAAEVTKLKRSSMAMWNISFNTGLPVKICRMISKGDLSFLEDGKSTEAPSGYIFLDDIKGKYGESVFSKVSTSTIPYHLVKIGGRKIGGRLTARELDLQMAMMFDNKTINLTSMPEYASLDFNARAQVRYTLRKNRVPVMSSVGASTFVQDEYIDAVVDAIRNTSKEVERQHDSNSYL
jgi:hypothetical protein